MKFPAGAFLLLVFSIAGVAACGRAPAGASATPSAAAASSTPQSAGVSGLASSLVWDGVDQKMLLTRVVQWGVQPPRLITSPGWALGPGGWTQLTAPAALPELAGNIAFLAYDSDRNRELMFVLPPIPGGPKFDPSRQGVWTWDGRSWTQARPGGGPAWGSGYASVVYSPDLHATVFLQPNATPQSQGLVTWLFDDTGWHSILTPHWPDVYGGLLSYDPIHHAVVTLDQRLWVTWRFDGKDWSSVGLTGDVTPMISERMGRQSPAVGFDPRRADWVVFGGNDAAVDHADTWIGDGTSWKQVAPATSPSGRTSSMAWDPATAQMILFGGESMTPSYARVDLADTWAWDGSTWIQLAGPYYPPAPSPTPETSPASPGRTDPPPSPTPATSPASAGRLVS